jgi:hypothetical protein
LRAHATLNRKTCEPAVPASCHPRIQRLDLLSQIPRNEGLLSPTGGLVILAFRQDAGISMNDFAGHYPKLPSALRADCSRCAGLCCVVHPFYSIQGFAFDKPAHSACRHLTPENRCAVHTGLSSRGFPGCVAFDCYGAGQRVTQELFAGVNWRTSRETAAQIFSAYEVCLALHRLMAMLLLAEAVVPPMHSAQMRLKRGQLDELCRSEETRAGNLDISALQNEVLVLIRDKVLPVDAEALSDPHSIARAIRL